MHSIVAASVKTSAVLVGVDFTHGAVGAAALPSYASFSRASPATVADYAAGIVVTVGNNAPRTGKSAAGRVGLRFECTRLNGFASSRRPDLADPGAGSLDAYVTGRTGPDGTANATRVTVGSGGFTRNAVLGAPGNNTYALSEWIAKGLGTGAYQMADLQTFSNAAPGTAIAGTAGAAWHRIALRTAHTAGGTAYAIPLEARSQLAIGGAAAGALDADIDLIQWEIGGWASEAIITTGSQASRAGERQWISAASQVVSGGRVGFRVLFEAPAAIANYAVDFAAARLWSIDASNYAELVFATGLINIVIAGATWTTTTPLTFAAGDLVEVWLEAGGGSAMSSVFARVNGTVVALGSSVAAQTIIAPGANAIDVLCNGTTKQLSGLVLSWDFWRTGTRPSWAVDPGVIPLRYMPMGDSITRGPAIVNCWRNLLGARIASWSQTVSVGPLSFNPGSNTATALNHAGYTGATVQDLDGIVGTLFDPGNYDPNVTIFSLGTNNTGSAPATAIAAQKTLVTDILTRWPAMRFLFIGIYFQNAANLPTQAANAVTLNGLMQSDLLPWVAAQSVPYVFVNPQSAGGPGSGVEWNSNDFTDDLHPNDAGHAKMDLLVWPAFQSIVGTWGR